MGFFKRFQDVGRWPEEIQTASVIDFDLLLADITPENPSGDQDLEYDPAFIELEEKIKGTPEVEIGGKIVQEAKDPNWSEIQIAACELLARTHDIRVAVSLTRALMHNDGLIGLRDGLKLLHDLVEKFWDSIYPQLDPEDNNDPTQRTNILMTLCDYETAIAPLMGVPLCSSQRLGSYSLRDIRNAAGNIRNTSENGSPATSMATIEAAFKDCDVTTLLSSAAALGSALISLGGLENLLQDKVKIGSAPNFEDLRFVLEEIDVFLSQQLAKRDVPKKPASGKKEERQDQAKLYETTPVQTVSPQGVELMNSINSRQDVTRILDQICLYYEKNEPTSPVPLLLKRAKRLVEKNFFEIMQDLAPDSVGQIEKLIGGPEGKES